MKWKKFYVPQVDESDCGVAALATILKYHGSNIPLSKLRSIARTSIEGTSILGIVSAAATFGLTAKAVKANKDIFKEGVIKEPFIIHVIKSKKLLHYYVVLKVKGDELVIADPDINDGIKKVSITSILNEWTGIAVLIEKSKNYHQKKEPLPTLLSYRRLLYNHKTLVITIVLISIISTLLEVLGAFLFQGLIDTFIPQKMINTLTIVSIGLIFGYICSSISSFSGNYATTILGQKMSNKILMEYLDHTFKLPMSFFSSRKNGDIVSRFNDANKIVDAIASLFVSSIINLGMLIILSTILIEQNLSLFLVSLLSIPIYIVIILLFVKPFEHQNRIIMENNATTSSDIISSIAGIEALKSVNWEQSFLNRIQTDYHTFLKSSAKYVYLDQCQQALKSIIDNSLSVVILLIGAHEVLSGTLSLGALITFNSLLRFFTGPLQEIISLQPKIQSASVAANRLNEILSVPTENSLRITNSGQTHAYNNDYTISMEHVTFRYGFGLPTINNISCNFKQNSNVVIAGKSGGGKSTLAKLIAGFSECDEGIIRIGSVDISSLDKNTLRSKITYLPQTPNIFNGSIAENISMSYNKQNFNKEKFEKSIEISGLSSLIEKLPFGIETNIGEQGSLLSGGQKQRICLARALMSDADILILDESTSNLDALSENIIMKKIFNLNKTVITIAHRLKVASFADYMIVLEDGKIKDQGTPDALRNRSDYYSNVENI